MSTTPTPGPSPTGIPLSATTNAITVNNRKLLWMGAGLVLIVFGLIVFGFLSHIKKEQAVAAQAAEPAYPTNQTDSSESFLKQMDPPNNQTPRGAGLPPHDIDSQGHDVNVPELPPPDSWRQGSTGTLTGQPSQMSEAEQIRLAQYTDDQKAMTTPLTAPAPLDNRGGALPTTPTVSVAPGPQGAPPQGTQQVRLDDPLPYKRKPAAGQYMLPAGTWIHAKLEQKAISELPGDLRGRIDANIYDRGQRLLIPQGAYMIGTYSSRLEVGQDRLLQVWDRIIFPDNSSILLNDLTGTSLDGSSGLKDRVNNHVGRLIRDAAITTVFAVGIAVTQRQNTSLLQAPSYGTAIGQQVGANLGELMAESTRLNLNRPPTAEIRPGAEFDLLTNRDIVFEEPYK